MNPINPYSIPPLASSIVFLLLGAAVYFKNRRSSINITFFLVSFITFWWQFSWFILFNTRDEVLASYLVRVGYMGIIFIPVFFYHFFLAFLGKIKGFDKYFLYLSYGLSFLFEVSVWTGNYFIQGYWKYFWGFYPKANFLHLVFLFFLTIVSIRGVYLLATSFLRARKEDPGRASQIKYILVAFLIYFMAASDFLVNYGVEFYPFGFVFILAFLLLTAYAITKYNLFEIRVILTEVLVSAMGVTSLIEALLFQEFWSKVFGFGVFAMFCLIGYLLIRYTYREVSAKETLEQKVQERTKELEASKKVAEERATELEKWYNLTIGRELRMAELKKKIKDLEGDNI